MKIQLVLSWQKINKGILLKYCQLYPAGIVLLGILTALVPLNINSNLPLWIIISLSISIAFLMSVISVRTALNFLIWFLLGLGSFYLNEYLMQSGSTSQNTYNSTYTRINITALDPSLSVLSIPWMEPPNYLFVDINSIKFIPDTEPKKSSGKIYLSNKKLYPFEYGKSYTITGILSPAEEQYDKSFANYLKSMGIIYSFMPEEITPDKEESNHWFLKKMITLRDNILTICSYNIEDKSVNQFLAGILFGCRQGLDQNIKKQFLDTGTIHIIAISGSHIGILAILFLLFFRPVPIRLRYTIIPIFLLGYIIIIGYLPSAIRAFIMISFFMLIKAILRTQKPMNILYLTASLMLLFNPYSMMNPGFTFSFIIVIFLILGWEAVSTISECHNEIYYWKPDKGLSFSRKIRNNITRNIFIAITTTIIAGFASIPLQLYYNNIFTPIMPIANIILLPLLLPFFFFCILKIFFYPLLQFYLVNSFFNFFISGIVNSIFKTVELGYNTNTSFYLVQPPLIFVVIFYLTLICILALFRKKLSWIFGIILVLLTASLVCSPLLQKNKVIFLKEPGESPVSVLLLNPKESSAIVLNCPAYSAFDIINVLKSNGINKISAIYAIKLNSYYAGNIKKLSETYPPEQIVILHKSQKSKLSKELENFCKQSDIGLTVPHTKNETVTTAENNICISDGRNSYNIEKKEPVPGQVVYSLCKNDKKVGITKFTTSNKLEEQTIEL